MTATRASELRITHVGEPRGVFPEHTHVDFVTHGDPVDEDEILAALRAVEDPTCGITSYDPSTREGCYCVVDADPQLHIGQVITIEAIPALDASVLRHAHDAGKKARGIYDKDTYWPAWWAFSREHPVAEARRDTQASYFHGGWHDKPFSACMTSPSAGATTTAQNGMNTTHQAPDMSQVITYVHTDRSGHVDHRVAIPRKSVVYDEATYGFLDDATTPLFVSALKALGVPVERLVREAERHGSALGAGPLACIQTWHCPEPWPVFVTIGDACYAEFYPEPFAG